MLKRRQAYRTCTLTRLLSVDVLRLSCQRLLARSELPNFL